MIRFKFKNGEQWVLSYRKQKNGLLQGSSDHYDSKGFYQAQHSSSFKNVEPHHLDTTIDFLRPSCVKIVKY